MPNRRSKKHVEVVETIQSVFPYIAVEEEYAIRHEDKTYLLDVYIPKFQVAIEIQGAQHLRRSQFFHRGLNSFAKQVIRDDEKHGACVANNIRLEYVYPKDKVDREYIIRLLEGDRNDGRE